MERRPTIGIIIGTTREGRFGDIPAQWIFEEASARADLDFEKLDFEIVDLRDYPLPFLGEATTPACQSWSEKMDELDGYLFVTAEYNHSISGVLKNFLDHVHSEMGKKPAAFVGYGGVGGARAVEQLRLRDPANRLWPTARTPFPTVAGPALTYESAHGDNHC